MLTFHARFNCSRSRVLTNFLHLGSAWPTHVRMHSPSMLTPVCVMLFLHGMVMFMVALPLVFSTSHVKLLPIMEVRSLLTMVSTLV